MYLYLALPIFDEARGGLGGFLGWECNLIYSMCDNGTGVLCLQSHTVFKNLTVNALEWEVQRRHYSYTSSGSLWPQKVLEKRTNVWVNKTR
jgi:hypothetical protein